MFDHSTHFINYQLSIIHYFRGCSYNYLHPVTQYNSILKFVNYFLKRIEVN